MMNENSIFAKAARKVVVMVVVLMMFGTVAMAAPNPMFTLGGISLGTSKDYVRSVYGEPTIADKPQFRGSLGTITKWTYGNSFKITFSEDFFTNVKNGVVDIEVTANNGIKNGLSIGVGDPMRWVPERCPAGVRCTKVDKDTYRCDLENDIFLIVKGYNGKIVSLKLYPAV